jgi:hypothetical protein
MTDERLENDDLWRNWRAQIAEDLDRHRPDRYDRGASDWMGPIIARARGRMPTDDAVVIRDYVEKQVRNQETQATKRGNKFIREWFEGRRPLDWRLFGPCPIIVGTTHIRLDAATRQDVRDSVDQGHADNLDNYNRAEVALEGFRTLERRAAAQGYEQLSLLGDLPPNEGRSKAA